jgi:zinc/manganese transport system substrate-binding protein
MGGPWAGILSNPNKDPHLFETTPTIVRQIAAAQIVIFNGAGYDAWMGKLLELAMKTHRLCRERPHQIARARACGRYLRGP